MPLPLPSLDTRRWSDLVDEARAMITRYAPNWTDHNIHDPGITLVELLAWLVEMDIYQLNRVPAAHKRKFLALVGVRPLGAQAARALLSVTPERPASMPADATLDAVDLLAGAQFVATSSEKNTATATVSPNCLKYWPAMPPMNETGAKAAMIVAEIAMTARPISSAASSDAR